MGAKIIMWICNDCRDIFPEPDCREERFGFGHNICPYCGNDDIEKVVTCPHCNDWVRESTVSDLMCSVCEDEVVQRFRKLFPAADDREAVFRSFI